MNLLTKKPPNLQNKLKTVITPRGREWDCMEVKRFSVLSMMFKQLLQNFQSSIIWVIKNMKIEEIVKLMYRSNDLFEQSNSCLECTETLSPGFEEH